MHDARKKPLSEIRVLLIQARNTLEMEQQEQGQAHTMLRRLSGETHTVFTGLALLHPASDRRVCAYEATRVTFAALSDEEIRTYVASGAPMDKAGAYGIQGDLGAVFVTRIEGDFYTVMGLPLHRLYRLLHDHFSDLIVLST